MSNALFDFGDRLQQNRNADPLAAAPTIHPLLAAAMSSNGNLAMSGVNDRAANAQADADTKTEYTFKGDGTVNVKNMPATDFLATARQTNAVTAAKMHALVVGAGAETPDPNDPALAGGGQSFRGGYDAARELGSSRLRALLHGIGVAAHLTGNSEDALQAREHRAARDVQTADAAIKTGVINPDNATRAGVEEARTNLDLLSLKPSERIAYEERQTSLAREEARRREVTARDADQLLNTIVDNGVRSYGSSPDEAIKAIRPRFDRFGGPPPGWEDAVKNRWQEDDNRMTAAGLRTFAERRRNLKVEDVHGYKPSEFDRFYQDQFGDLPPQSKPLVEQARARFNGLQEDVAAKGREEKRAQDRLDAMWTRIERATQEKPEVIHLGEVRDATADDLVSMRGNAQVNQPVLESRLRVKGEQLQHSITTAKAKMLRARAQAAAIEGKPYEDFGDPEQLAGLKRDVLNYQDTIAEANRQLGVLRGTAQAAPTPRGATAAPTEVTQQEWDALIHSGETPQTLAAAGMKLKK